MQRAIAGDAAAFGELIARHHTSALRLATVILGTSTGTDDVMQEATIRAWRQKQSIIADLGFRNWYLRVVTNTARNSRRASWRRSNLEMRAAVSEGTLSPNTGPADPAELAVKSSEREIVLAAMNQLKRNDRTVLALRFFEQLTETEMAGVMDCSPGTVKSRLSRALVRLRKQIEPLAKVTDP